MFLAAIWYLFLVLLKPQLFSLFGAHFSVYNRKQWINLVLYFRPFPLRRSKQPVYPKTKDALEKNPILPSKTRTPPRKISEIIIRNHPFDEPSRKRTKKAEPSGVSDFLQPSKGVTGIRSYHKLNEGNMNQLARLGRYSAKTLPN